MNKLVKTTADGWECVPQLKKAVNQIELLHDEIYEIKNCRRSNCLDNIVYAMRESLENALNLLDEIDVDVQYETVIDEE